MIKNLIKEQKDFFGTQRTKDTSYRKKQLQQLLQEVIRREDDIVEALHNDFKKSEFESIITETSTIISSLKRAISEIDSWSRPQRVRPSLINFPSKARIYKEPYGNVLIIAPWNYPYQLALAPLIGAIAAGNTVVLKPSELTPHTSQIIKEIIESVFDKKYVAVVEGGIEVSQSLLAERWDYVFFTGSVHVGKIVAQAAAKFLTPVTLELGGKSPCIIDETADLKLTAKRIVWGKFINAGQTCIAPDYVLISKKSKKAFITHFKQELERAYGSDPSQSPDFPRIINEKNWERLSEMIEGKIVVGGEKDKNDLYIAPTLIDEPALDSKIMQEEIFGPILPIISYETREQVNDIIDQYEKPLSLYVFSINTTFIKSILDRFSFGGGAVNDTIMHVANHRLPFGGVGESGMGEYHGSYSFDTFTHHKSIVHRYNWLDIPLRYAPYTNKIKYLKKLLKFI